MGFGGGVGENLQPAQSSQYCKPKVVLKVSPTPSCFQLGTGNGSGGIGLTHGTGEL